MMQGQSWAAGGLAFLAMLALATQSWGAMVATGLRCEYAPNPLGVDALQPRLSWVLQSSERGQTQTAYQVLVAASEAKLAQNQGDLWDSGRVASSASLHVVYAGKPLTSGQRVFWKVRVWDRDGQAGGYSEPAWWEMGLLNPTDWQGRWIRRDEPEYTQPEQFYEDRPAPLFRKEFSAAGQIRRARLYITGLGYYEASLNGRRVGDHVLDPGWTSYARRVFYSTYDVTDLLKAGPNAIGVTLGNGWYNPLPLMMWGGKNIRDGLTVGHPRLIAQLNIEYADGKTQSVVTDPSWKVGNGPIIRNSIYLGEVYDARAEQPGWDKPGYQDSAWTAAVVEEQPLGALRTQFVEPIRVARTIKPVAITEPTADVHIFDLGENFAGWVRLRVSGPRGTRVTMRFGELLYPDGKLNVMTSVAGQIKQPGMGGPGAPPVAFQSGTYILKGEGQEVYTPRFAFHGFRYVEVSGYPGKPGPEAIEGMVLHSAVDSAGDFACSNDLFNRIQDIVRRTLLSNMFSVQSDCPHREKFGYGGDIIAASEMGMFNFDMSRFYAKAMYDVVDALRENGGATETAPFVGIADNGFGDGSGPIAWASVLPVLQWQLYQYYGNRQMLEEMYEPTKRFVHLLESESSDLIITDCISDHEGLAPKPVALTSTAFFYVNALTLSQIAGVLDRQDDKERYAALAGKIRDAFNARFLKSETGTYDLGTQACQAFALYFDLVPAGKHAAVLDVLVKDIMETHKGHLSTGIFGTKYMLNALGEHGRTDVAETIVNQKTFPGWGHMLENGATTLWEHWEFSDNTFSHNHPMFGSVSEWFYKWLAGIQPAADAVGFDKVVIRPQVVGDLTWARASYASIRGPVSSHWKREAGRFVLQLSLPPGITAKVYIPASDPKKVTESGAAADQAKGVRFLKLQDGCAVYEVGSGSYQFAAAQ